MSGWLGVLPSRLHFVNVQREQLQRRPYAKKTTRKLRVVPHFLPVKVEAALPSTSGTPKNEETRWQKKKKTLLLYARIKPPSSRVFAVATRVDAYQASTTAKPAILLFPLCQAQSLPGAHQNGLFVINRDVYWARL